MDTNRRDFLKFLAVVPFVKIYTLDEYLMSSLYLEQAITAIKNEIRTGGDINIETDKSNNQILGYTGNFYKLNSIKETFVKIHYNPERDGAEYLTTIFKYPKVTGKDIMTGKNIIESAVMMARELEFEENKKIDGNPDCIYLRDTIVKKNGKSLEGIIYKQTPFNPKANLKQELTHLYQDIIREIGGYMMENKFLC